MQRDPRWMKGRVAETASLLPLERREPNRETRLIKVEMLEGHASYEPGKPFRVQI